jgi:hypothetical protein
VSRVSLYGTRGGRRESGKAVARIGLRMMPTFPPPPLRCRTAGFPQYGSKASLSGRAFPDGLEVKLAPGIPPVPTRFASALRVPTGTRPLGASRLIALTDIPEESSPLATPLNPTGPLLRKGYAVPSLLATTTRPASLAGTRGLHGFPAYTAGPRWAGAPEATRETFPALVANLSSIAVLHPRRETARLPLPNYFGERVGHRTIQSAWHLHSPQSALSTLTGS